MSTTSAAMEIEQICCNKNIVSISQLLSNCSETTLFHIEKNLQDEITPDILIFTDGNCKNNGKKKSKAGFSIFFDDTTLHNKFSTTQILETDEPTNNKAELTAILCVFKILDYNREEFVGRNITICSDSMYSLNCINKWYINWIRNDWKTSNNQSVKNKEIIQKIIDLKKIVSLHGINITFKHISAHKKEPVDRFSLEHKLWYGNNYVDQEINKLLSNY